MTSSPNEGHPQLDRNAEDDVSVNLHLNWGDDDDDPTCQREEQSGLRVDASSSSNNNETVGEVTVIALPVKGESSEPNSVVEDGDNPTYDSIDNGHSSSSYSSSSSSSSDESTVTSDGENFPWRRRRRRGDRNRHGIRDRRHGEEPVLVLIGCKSCMTYFMAKKAVTMECPGCDGGSGGGIVRFDR